MKVLQLLPSLGIGGVERGVVELSRRLCESGVHSVVVSKGGDCARQIAADGGEWIEFDCASKNLLSAPARVSRLRRLLRQTAPDIVHLRSRVPAWLFRFARRGLALRAVSTIHGIYNPGFYSQVMTRADAVICPSRAVLEYAQKEYHAPPDKLHLIHRGTDFDYFHPQQIDRAFCGEFRAKHQLQNKRVALLAARLTQLKGHEIFIRALAASDGIVGLIVGGGSESRRRRLMELARGIGVGGRVIFAGAQSQMREIYAVADVTVSASLRPEAFGRTIAESLAMSTPVAASAHGGALDIVNNGINGFLSPPGDPAALADAMNKALTLKDTKKLRESVLPMSLDAMCEKTLALYRRLLPPSPGAG